MRTPDGRGPFHRHRLALTAADSRATADDLRATLAEIRAIGPGFFTRFLADQGLSSYWWDALERLDLSGELDPATAATLRRARLTETASYLAQRAALTEIDGIFEARAIRHAVIKGAWVRERVYTDPSLRPACDIDLLVVPQDRLAAIQALQTAGFTLRVDPEVLSHEVGLSRAGVHIDLHWDILRPGRTRIPVVGPLLGRRQRIDGLWGLADADAVFLMLVHPAFAKYVCSPNMDLNKVVDFTRWTSQRDIDWHAVAARLAETGLGTAAWMVLAWYAMLLAPAPLPMPEGFLGRIAPGPLRQAYLRLWLERDLPTRWLDKPARIQLGLTLFLHDRARDAGHALASILRERRNGRGEHRLELGRPGDASRQW